MKWKETVGESISAATEPVGYKNGMLWVWVKSSSWMQQLVFMRADIQETINSKMGTKMVRSIRFTLDRREVPEDAEAQQELRGLIDKIIPPGSEDL